MKNSAKITVIIPTYNEAFNIEAAIKTVSFADEILVIDSYSTDNTVEIVKSCKNIKLIQRRFDDFSSQKNYALSQAKYDWILLLDADERVTNELKEEILTIITGSNEFSAYYIYRNFFFRNKRLKYSGWQRDKVIRLFKRKENFYKGKVHEHIVSNGKIGFLNNKLNHYSYKNQHQYKKKLTHYAKLQALELYEKGKRANIIHFLFKPLLRFLIQFFIKLGFLDGINGFKISLAHSYGVYLRYLELYRLQKGGSTIKNNEENKSKLRIGYEAKRVFHNTTGLGNYSRDLIRILADYYPLNDYYLYNPKPKRVDRLKLTKNIIEKLPTSKFWKNFSSIWRQGPVSRQIIDDEVDIFHGLSGEIPRGLKKAKVKVVVTIHDLIFVRYPHTYSFFDRKIHFMKSKYACKKADIIIAISEQTKKDIVNYLSIDPKKIRVVYQGCHAIFKQQMPQYEIDQVLKKYNLPNDFIINVGTIQERKNALTIVKAVKNIDTKLVVIGKKTEYYKQIELYIEKNKLQDKVFFLEGVSLKEIACLYQQAKLSVYPSVFEGFGIPIIESIFCKTPVITTQGGVFPEVGGEHSVYLEDPYDVNEMVVAIKKILSSNEIRKEIAEKGFDFVQKFNDDKIAENLMSVYNDLLGRG